MSLLSYEFSEKIFAPSALYELGENFDFPRLRREFSYEFAENSAPSARNLMSLLKIWRAFSAENSYEFSEKATFFRFHKLMSFVSYEFTATLL